jgi:hypothetical protein
MHALTSSSVLPDSADLDSWLEAQPPVGEAEASRLSHTSRSKLRASRLVHPRCDGPPFIRVGRQVLYRPVDIHRWLLSKRVVPASAFRVMKGEQP